jgi:hypothetical protein
MYDGIVPRGRRRGGRFAAAADGDPTEDGTAEEVDVGMMEEATAEQVRRSEKRRGGLPVFVTVTAFLLALHAGYNLLIGVGSLIDLGVFSGLPLPDFVIGETLTAEGSQFVVSIIALVFGTIALVILVGFLLRQPWAWTAAMTWGALSMALNLVNYFRHDPNYLSMLVNAVFILVLNLATVQRAFRKADE